MSLSMLQMKPDIGRLTRWAITKSNIPADAVGDTGYVLHAALTAAFGKDHVPRPYALDRKGDQISLLAYTQSDPEDIRAQAATFAEPEVLAALGYETFAAKTMPTMFPEGTRLGFKVLTRPTIRYQCPRSGKTMEKDAFLAEVHNGNGTAERSRSEVYIDWIKARLINGGATPEMVSLASFKLAKTVRRTQPTPKTEKRSLVPVVAPETLFSGILEVQESAKFAETLAKGIGRHKSFGYGMLLIQRPH